LGTRAGVILAVDLIASRKQPIHIVQAAATGIHAHNRAGAFALIQCQGLLSRLYQRLQRLVQLRLPVKEPIHDHFLITNGVG
jgi:hypothetical protein